MIKTDQNHPGWLLWEMAHRFVCLSSSYGYGQASWSCSQCEVTLPIWQVINFHKLHWNIWFFLLVIERYLNVIKHFWVALICTIDNHARLGLYSRQQNSEIFHRHPEYSMCFMITTAPCMNNKAQNSHMKSSAECTGQIELFIGGHE